MHLLQKVLVFILLSSKDRTTLQTSAFCHSRGHNHHHILRKNVRSQASSVSHLHVVNPIVSIESLSAAAAVACPTFVGMKADHIRSGLGPLVTILMASHFSSLHLCPSTSRLYEVCWTRFLPASLSLLLLAPSIDNDEDDNEDVHQEIAQFSGKRKRTRDSAKHEVIAMSIPFLLGCLGSILGCLLSYFICWLGKDNGHRVHSHILRGRKHFWFQPGHLLLNPPEAAVCAGCLLSSFIGGSTNYFAAARSIASDRSLKVDANAGVEEVLHGTFGSVASDMLVMPMYYGVLTAMTSSSRLRKWFPGRSSGSLEEESISDDSSTTESTRRYYQESMVNCDREKEDALTINTNTSRSRLAVLSIQEDISMNCPTETSTNEHELEVKSDKWKEGAFANTLSKSGYAIGLVLPIVWSIVALSESLEATSGIPGIGIASISILSCLGSKILTSFYQTKVRSHIGKAMQQLSDICYYMLLSVIGISINLRRLTLEGWWASCSSAIFAAVPLLVHFVVILFGSLGFMKLLPSYKLGIEQIVAASNAAICGPFTAAALVAKVSGDMTDSSYYPSIRWKGLALAATFWGIFGYAIATNIGVSISRALLMKLG